MKIWKVSSELVKGPHNLEAPPLTSQRDQHGGGALYLFRHRSRLEGLPGAFWVSLPPPHLFAARLLAYCPRMTGISLWDATPRSHVYVGGVFTFSPFISILSLCAPYTCQRFTCLSLCMRTASSEMNTCLAHIIWVFKSHHIL